ncbi:MAG: amidohydrolase [Deltaproteobacteria bacterium]|nr:amidohydrolase [Deltaproteobacteria bacterium]
MPSKEELKAKVCLEIDKRSSEIIEMAKNIGENPETGFREVKTARLVAEKFAALGLTYGDGLALTGVKAVLPCTGEGPTVAVLGELDSLIVPDHPLADPKTGAAHACGHHGQIGMLIGSAIGILGARIADYLSGRIVFMAVPAEEYIEIGFRDELRKSGKITYLAGKQELIKLGQFDDIDMAMMTHSLSIPGDKKIVVGGTSNGMVAKQVRFIGRSAHAGSSPHQGINALNAAMIALNAINSQRETFRDQDAIRVHPIITRGGETVNIVPADVRMETYVRGRTMNAIQSANGKVDRCLRAGALAVGGKVGITTLPGYSPMMNNEILQDVYYKNAVLLLGESAIIQSYGHMAGSTDMGDVSQIMPAIHSYAGGTSGITHGNDFLIRDYEQAVLVPAKIMAMTVIDLLADGAAKAREIKENSTPLLSKEQYISSMNGLLREAEYAD